MRQFATVHLTFHDKEVREVCEKERIARLRLGNQGAEDLKVLLADMIAAKSLEDLPFEIRQVEAGVFAVDVGGEVELVLQPNTPPKQLHAASVEAYGAVESIQIMRVQRDESC